MPCSTPGVPIVSVAADRSGRPSPSPPASQPMSRTPSSGMNAWKMPIALLPPPTPAPTGPGGRQHRLARLGADGPLEVAHHHRERVRAPHAADAVVGVVHGGHPVAE